MATKKTDHEKAKSMKRKLEWVQKCLEEGGGNKGDKTVKRKWTEVEVRRNRESSDRKKAKKRKKGIKKNRLQRRGNSREAAECC